MSNGASFDADLVQEGIKEYRHNSGLACAFVLSAVTPENLGSVLESLPTEFRRMFERWLLDIAKYPGIPIGWGKPLAADIREAALRLLETKGLESQPSSLQVQHEQPRQPHELRKEVLGRKTLWVIRLDYRGFSPNNFSVDIVDEEDGYVFLETFGNEADAVKVFTQKVAEMRKEMEKTDASKTP